ncbi:MAG: hypothetical protein CR975_05785 [Gammaproteobacteria bacterium]|nr:MAG: hypothetical protein CR975_05785 [Gammaproteobacteria bacterium]
MSQEIIITLIISTVIALVVGFFIGRAIGGGKATNSQLAEAKKELEDYKNHVSEHFGKTADLVDDLTQSYKAVFDHLGSSAKSLLSEEQVKQHLSTRAAKAVTLTYITEESSAESDANPMQTAQNEIHSQAVVEKATQDAQKMAESLKNSDDPATDSAAKPANGADDKKTH